MTRIAIVGAGPKALHAIERLVAALREHPTPLQIDVFDPAHAGAGPAYAPDLDPALLMNLRTDAIDAWPRVGPGAVADDAAHPSLAAWCVRRGLTDAYLPRAVVGRYLAEAWQRVVADAPSGTSLRHHRNVIDDVRDDPFGDRWWLNGADGEAGPYDHVLLATGHGPPAPTDARRLPLDALAACRLVAVRGAGLTALDLVRGLAARRARRGDGPHVLLVSRTGRPLSPKPAPQIDELWRATLQDARGLVRPRLQSVAAIRRVVTDDAAVLLGGPSGTRFVRGALAALEERAPMDQAAARAAIATSLTGVRASRPTDPALALGAAWRWRYPQLVDQAGYGAIHGPDLRAFQRLAAAMEPIAFGPPVAALDTLLAALDEGWVTLAHAPTRVVHGLHGGMLERPGVAAVPVDAVVEAVLPAPGASGPALIRRLVARGVLQQADGGRGVRVCADGTALMRDEPRHGLAVIGRATEDWVIGNDTLDRELHGTAAAWAARVASSARRSQRERSAEAVR